ncbi:MAG: hypothetical protein Unbinned4234contig1002_10 [Prokaryotic dsDNA virus sp.]|jgi:predicted secreted protein|nr:MAG: hypothetical protein Unbinned4234contig1002_10 [Prokaryotic dsDNA virus sp.]|tara:strand:- start:16953 stop:17342 length:390 start_codon:yes stop_codon:yes gene_type:complete
MATHSGKDGLVKVGANTVAEVRNWSLDLSADTIEDTVMGDAARSYLVGLTTASASFDCYWDETDTNGQQAVDPGSSITLVLYPEGADSGDSYFTGTALVTSKAITGTFDGMVEASYSATYSGAVTEATV